MADRHAFRAFWHDYNVGVFFVTICAKDTKNIFGTIRNGEMHDSRLGAIVRQNINSIHRHTPEIEIHNYVVMPNHVHLILSIGPITSIGPIGPYSTPEPDPHATENVGTRPAASTESSVLSSKSASTESNVIPNQPKARNLGCLKPSDHEGEIADFHHNSKLSVAIGSMKAAVTRTARAEGIISGSCWQPRFHDHIIRNQRAYQQIMQYVDNNVYLWHRDCYHSPE